MDALAIMDVLIHRLENTDLSAELADEAPGAVDRQRLLDDAKRRWDLGFYKEALSLYRRARGIQDDLSVAIKIGGLRLSRSSATTPMRLQRWWPQPASSSKCSAGSQDSAIEVPCNWLCSTLTPMFVRFQCRNGETTRCVNGIKIDNSLAFHANR
jgi:hypothetical protein